MIIIGFIGISPKVDKHIMKGKILKMNERAFVIAACLLFLQWDTHRDLFCCGIK